MIKSRKRFAARAVYHWQNLIENHGSLIAAIAGPEKISVNDHYPQQDWKSCCNTFQAFYHCHRPDDINEHGHIHLFKNFPGQGPVHLFAISIDSRGLPQAFFNVSPEVASDKNISPKTRASALKDGIYLRICDSRDEYKHVALFIMNISGMYIDSILEMIEAESNQREARTCHEIIWRYDINWIKDLDKL